MSCCKLLLLKSVTFSTKATDYTHLFPRSHWFDIHIRLLLGRAANDVHRLLTEDVLQVDAERHHPGGDRKNFRNHMYGVMVKALMNEPELTA